jgi:hypothetical protein
MWRPSEFIFALDSGPIPWNLPAGRALTNAGPISGAMTNGPFGLAVVGASFARSLLQGVPTEAFRPKKVQALREERQTLR